MSDFHYDFIDRGRGCNQRYGRLLVQLTSMGHSDGLFNKIDNVYEVIMNNSHEYYQKAKKENNDKIESLFYYIVNNQELLAKDRADILLTGSVKVE